MYSTKINEETLKNQIRRDFFSEYDSERCFDNIDFSVALKEEGTFKFDEREFFLWAEAKAGNKHDLFDSVVQLILTIGKARTLDNVAPPHFLGAFDAEKIAFVPYSAVMQVFSQNDFNWNVTPSDHSTKEFKQLHDIVSRAIAHYAAKDKQVYIYYFGEHDKELHTFIRRNFISGKDHIQRLRVNHNNFVHIFQKWRKEVMPTINVNWDKAKEKGIIEAYFFLADLIAENNRTLMENLHVLLQDTHYELDRQIDSDGFFTSKQVQFKDKMQAHTLFWTRYARPPKQEYWDRIVERQDLLVPQDVRERKGSFFTPAIWVEKSQEYLEKVLGEKWQEEYYIWDCCAGTGNLLANLTNKYHIWASTLDMADVKVMQERIQMMGKGANLLPEHVFQFDFLNDSFEDEKLPQSLRDVLQDEEKRKKLIIYINPPYAEAASATTITGSTKNKPNVATESYVAKRYKEKIGAASNELFAQFFIRVYHEIPSCLLAEFSKLKILQAPNFADFREIFQAKLESLFLVPADTFDNVRGNFPIGFFIWNTNKKEIFTEIIADVFTYDHKRKQALSIGTKKIETYYTTKYINSWYAAFYDSRETTIGIMNTRGNDFQNHNYIRITTEDNRNHTNSITRNNLIHSCIYLAVRHCIEATWLNDRDQFSYPNDGWKTDKGFQLDCLAYTLFHGQNRISCEQGVNHWIPFTEQEVDAPDNFSSHFMSEYIRDFLAGKIDVSASGFQTEKDLFSADEHREFALSHETVSFSAAAQDVMDAGKAIWTYYLHYRSTELYADKPNVNAAFYDIRRYFQGVNEKGKMNNESTDETYMTLLRDLRQKQKVLAKQIAEKVYQYGFLR